MKKPLIVALCAVVVLGLGISAGAFGMAAYTLSHASAPAPSEQLNEYIMYVGTNDKDTYEPVMEIEAARGVVENKLMDHFPDGFTMYDAKGVWRDEHMVITLEYSFICVIVTERRTEIYKVADELIAALNQSTILIVTNAVKSIDFYTGANY